MISTRLPIESTWPKWIDSSQSMPMKIWSVSWRPGMSSSLPFGAPLPTNTASNSPLSSSAFEAVDRRVVADVDAHVEDVADLLVEDLLGQAERRDVDAHQAAGPRQLLEDRDLVAERHQVVGDRERRRARRRCSATRLPFFSIGRRRQQVLDVAAMVGGDALQPADRDRLAVDAPAPARRLARPVARAPEDAREHVRLAVEHVGVGEPALRDQPDVFRDVGVRRTGPLAVDDPVVVVRVANVGWTHRVVIIGR